MFGELPATGVVEFDRLMVGTKTYRRWVDKIANRGFGIEESTLGVGTAAEISQQLITVDPLRFRFIDLLHESRHVRQIEKAEQQGYDLFASGRYATLTRAWFERGAYEYELRLGLRVGFSPEYMAFLVERIGFYWKRSYQQEFRFSLAVQRYLTGLWR